MDMLEDESITHVIPPLFIDASQRQPHQVLSYPCTVTGAENPNPLLPEGFAEFAQRCVRYVISMHFHHTCTLYKILLYLLFLFIALTN